MQIAVIASVICAIQTAEKNAGSLAVEVRRASEHIEKLAERARVAESAQKEAHSQLKSAGLEASTARKLVEAVSGILSHFCTCVFFPEKRNDG